MLMQLDKLLKNNLMLTQMVWTQYEKKKNSSHFV